MTLKIVEKLKTRKMHSCTIKWEIHTGGRAMLPTPHSLWWSGFAYESLLQVIVNKFVHLFFFFLI